MSNKSSDPSTGSRYTRALRLLAALAMVLGMLAANLPARPVRAATYTVTSTADSGAGTLRDAINQVNAGGGGDTIDISATGTILLTSWLPQLAKNVTINGPGANLLAIDGAGLYRPFIVASTVTDATISGLTIRHGYTTSLGGAIFNDGTLTVMDEPPVRQYLKRHRLRLRRRRHRKPPRPHPDSDEQHLLSQQCGVRRRRHRGRAELVDTVLSDGDEQLLHQ